MLYDDRGRVYSTVVHGVDPASGAITGSLAGNTWYDAAGNVIKQQAVGQRTFTKTAYDGAGRAIAAYTGYDLDESSYSDATSITDDTVLEQVEAEYDDDGSLVLVTTRRRLPTADGTFGSLGDATTPPLARVSYQAAWYDMVGRLLATADYGTNGGQVVTRPTQTPAPSDTVLVTTVGYNDRGEAFQTTDPAGKVRYAEFDDAGRQITQIQNYVDGVANAATPDQDVTVRTTYTRDGQVATLTAVNPATGNQVTRYIYGTSPTNSAIARNDLLAAEIYPDGTALADQVSYTYNRQGQVVTKTDQNRTVHTYSYDPLGRPLADSVTAVGSGVDGTIGSIARAYTVQGQVQTISSYYATSGGTSLANQVAFVYNPFGQLSTEYQEHDGAVNSSTSPKVGYSYADGSQGYIRLTQLVYPNGRTLTYGYSSGSDDVANRVSFLADSSPLPPGEGQGEGYNQQLVSYQYLGLSSILDLTYPQPGVRGTYDVDPSAPGTYPGLDQFGRVVDLLWQNTATGAALDRVQHGYDRAGNRLWRQCPVATAAGQAFDELYPYDGVNQLRSFQRGSLAGGQTAIATGSENFAQQWTLDATGNWVEFQEDDTGSGTWNLDQTRTHDTANEIASFAATAGPTWAQPAYDHAGNMTLLPQPAAPTASFTCTYDAWNRLVKVVDASTSNIVATYAYDGRGFRVLRGGYTSGTLSERRHFYYNSSWQVLEERIEQTPIPNPQSLIPSSQYVWGLRYIDDLVLRDCATFIYGNLTERLYALQDPNWNVVAIADASGGISERYQYTAYGVLSVLSPAFASISATLYDWSYAFTGRPLDSATGLYDYRARPFGAGLGRFLGRDPMGYGAGDINLQRYVGGSPLVSTDPSGRGNDCLCGMEIGDKLKAVLNKMLNKLRDDRELASSVQKGRWNQVNGWDIVELASQKDKFVDAAKKCGIADCKDTASVNGVCYHTHAINYVLWGALARYFATPYGIAEAAVEAHRAANLIANPSDPMGLDERLVWTRMGENGQLQWTPVESHTGPAGEAEATIWNQRNEQAVMKGCPSCGGDYKGTLTVTLRKADSTVITIVSD
jgi:RHS repeat-associated protein